MKQTKKKTYTSPNLTTYKASELIRMVGPATALYGPMQP